MRYGEIIAVGSELLLGGRLDTNSLFLTEGLASVGVEVRFKSVVGDEEADIVRAIRAAVSRAGVVLLTGGLGPTGDDCTREAVARATGRSLRRNAEALEGMRQRLAAWGRTPTRAQLRQGLIPSGAEVLANPVGSAPGFALAWRGCLIAALPGVPAEAEAMFSQALAPKLATAQAGAGAPWIRRHLLHTFGVPETELEERLRTAIGRYDRVRLGLLASPLGVTVSLTEVGEAGHRARDGEFDRAVRAVRRRVGVALYGEGADTMERVIGRRLADRGLILAVAESCTGGLIGHRITQVPGSSAYLDRVAVCYSNRAKIELLGVPEELIRRHGAVSQPVAAAMARGIRLRSRASVGLSVTGIAGPDGGTRDKPVGLVYVGLNGRSGRSGQTAALTREFRFHGTRETIKLRASQAALNLLREWLMATSRGRTS